MDASKTRAGTFAGLLLECAVLLALWGVAVSWVGRGGPILAYDSFRDIAFSNAILHGQPWRDPMLLDQRAWYPQGMPAFFAGIAALSGRSALEVYSTCAYWAQWWNPLLLFLLVRRQWGRAVAWIALPCVAFGSRWWLLHSMHPMASVQSIALMLGTLLAWRPAMERGGRWLVLAGLLAALTLWCHVLCGALAIGAIGTHALGRLPAERSGEEARRALRRAAVVVLLGILGGAVPLWNQLGMPRLNEAPHHWFAPELHDLRFALQAWTPLVLPFGVFGLYLSARAWRQSGWLVAWWGGALAGSLLGYLGHDLGWPLPWVIPHEFQWHSQLALAIAAAIAIDRAARWAARFVGGRHVARFVLTLVVLGGGFAQWREARSYLLQGGPQWSPMVAVADWLERHSAPGTVLAAGPEPAYFICAMSGRKTVLLPLGHLNPAVDPAARSADLAVLLRAPVESVFVAAARRQRVDFLLATNDVIPQAAQEQRLAGWRSVEPVFRVDSLAVLYRVRRGD